MSLKLEYLPERPSVHNSFSIKIVRSPSHFNRQRIIGGGTTGGTRATKGSWAGTECGGVGTVEALIDVE